MSELCSLTAVQLLEGYRTRAFSPVEVAAAVLKRIEEDRQSTRGKLSHLGQTSLMCSA